MKIQAHYRIEGSKIDRNSQQSVECSDTSSAVCARKRHSLIHQRIVMNVTTVFFFLFTCANDSIYQNGIHITPPKEDEAKKKNKKNASEIFFTVRHRKQYTKFSPFDSHNGTLSSLRCHKRHFDNAYENSKRNFKLLSPHSTS